TPSLSQLPRDRPRHFHQRDGTPRQPIVQRGRRAGTASAQHSTWHLAHPVSACNALHTHERRVADWVSIVSSFYGGRIAQPPITCGCPRTDKSRFSVFPALCHPLTRSQSRIQRMTQRIAHAALANEMNALADTQKGLDHLAIPLDARSLLQGGFHM